MNALMTNFDLHHEAKPSPQKWEGLAELDRALAEGRLTAYRWKKAWADPGARALGYVVGALFVMFVAFVIYWDAFRG